MENKPESGSRLIHVVIPAVSTLLVAIIGLGTAIYQSEMPIRLTEVAETALASTLTAGPLLASPTPVTPSPVAATKTPRTPAPATKGPPPTRVSTTAPLSITVQNELYLPVKISIDSIDKGTIDGGISKTYLLDSFPVTVDWSVVKWTTTTGMALGNDMVGIFKGVTDKDNLIIDNVIDNDHYFYPLITNPGSVDCDVTINKGWDSEVVTKAVVPAKTGPVGLGYYRLYNNSNVFLACGTNTYWWGTLPDQGTPDSFYGEVDQQSGVIEFTLKP